MRVYVASCLKYAAELSEWMFKINHERGASWPNMVLNSVPETDWSAKEFWQLDVAEIQHADVVVVYAPNDDTLRGALVEVGVSLGANIPVVAVGYSHSFGSWQQHPLVYRVPDLKAAEELLDLMERRMEL